MDCDNLAQLETAMRDAGRCGSRYSMDQLSTEVESMPGEFPNVDVKLMKEAMDRKSTAGLHPNTLYMQCWCAAFDRLEFRNVPPRVHAFMLVRWTGD